MPAARFMPARRYTRMKHRIVCGKTDARGCQSCPGEMGHLIAKLPELNGQQYLYPHPLVNAAMARDRASGVYRISRLRRPFLSGSEASRHVGGGIAHAASANLLRDTQGQPLKWLELIYDADGHDRIIMACPRCQTLNEVAYGDFIAYVERDFAPR
ncbi:MAG TPA: hypothetical protein VGS80_03760 [Ktedonobacterales bacterium]|nr:hypothetical protein [Ktedonobacterales bacterium]